MCSALKLNCSICSTQTLNVYTPHFMPKVLRLALNHLYLLLSQLRNSHVHALMLALKQVVNNMFLFHYKYSETQIFSSMPHFWSRGSVEWVKLVMTLMIISSLLLACFHQVLNHAHMWYTHRPTNPSANAHEHRCDNQTLRADLVGKDLCCPQRS